MINTGLTDKVVLITGANGGIGAATARAFAAQDAVVAIHYLDAGAQTSPTGEPNVRLEHSVPGREAAEALANELAAREAKAVMIPSDLAEQVLPAIPLRRLGRPQDIADAVVFLASDQARWITGQVIQVAGGHWL